MINKFGDSYEKISESQWGKPVVVFLLVTLLLVSLIVGIYNLK